jgi:endo-1,4-beta-xylanase
LPGAQSGGDVIHEGEAAGEARGGRRRLTRRAYLAGLAGLGLAPAAAAQGASFCSDATEASERPFSSPVALGAISSRVAWGVKLEAPGIYDQALVDAIAAEKPQFLVVGSGLKFGNLHPQSMSFEGKADGKIFHTWYECDDIVAIAAKLGIPVRGDCLAWNDWLPDWLTNIARATGWQDMLKGSYEAHFRSVFSHFDDLSAKAGRKVMRWCGLVNEPFDPWAASGGRPGWRKGLWLDAFGLEADGVPGYIGRAFELAERFDSSSSTALFVNETNCDNDRFGPIVRPAMLRLVEALQRSGRKVDAVGLECHLMPQWMSDPHQPDWRPFVAFLKDLSARGVEIYLTELDVNDCSMRETAQRDRLVADYMRSFVAAALQVPAVTMVSNWDLSDKYSWLRENGSPSAVYPSLGRWANCVSEPPCPRPTIYDQAMRPKAARRGLAEALAGAR